MSSALDEDPERLSVRPEDRLGISERTHRVQRLALDQRGLLIWSREVRKTHDDPIDLIDDVAVQVTNAIAPRLDHALGDPFSDVVHLSGA